MSNALANIGEEYIAWASRYMPILAELERQFALRQPLASKKIAVCANIDAKTARLCMVLENAGAEVTIAPSGPLSVSDEVAEALMSRGFRVYGHYGASKQQYVNNLKSALEIEPDLFVDDGGDLLALLQGDMSSSSRYVLGGCEMSSVGVNRMRAREKVGRLDFPMIACDDAQCKRLFENRYGSGQSTLDAIMRSTNLSIAGKTLVIAGYGQSGSGIAEYARGLGAKVIVTEIDPIKALEASMKGYQVMSMDDAAPLGDVFITATNSSNTINDKHFAVMKACVLLCNAGRSEFDINKKVLYAMSTEVTQIRKHVQGFRMKDGRLLCLLSEGRFIGGSIADGNPTELVDMTYGITLMSLMYLCENGLQMSLNVFNVPREVDVFISGMKLDIMGIKFDRSVPGRPDPRR